MRALAAVSIMWTTEKVVSMTSMTALVMDMDFTIKLLSITSAVTDQR